MTLTWENVYRSGALIPETEYTTREKHSDDFIEYEYIEFTRDQVDARGSAYEIVADITTDMFESRVGGTSADAAYTSTTPNPSNPALVIKFLLSNRTFGLGLTVSRRAFDRAERDYNEVGVSCSGGLYTQKVTALDVINLCLLHGAVLSRNEQGDYTVVVDTEARHTATSIELGGAGAPEDNLKTDSIERVSPTKEELTKKLVLHGDYDPGFAGEGRFLDVATYAALRADGREVELHNPYLDGVQVNQQAWYLSKRLAVLDRPVVAEGTSACADVQLFELATVTIPFLRVDKVQYEVRRVGFTGNRSGLRTTISFPLLLTEYNAAAYRRPGPGDANYNDYLNNLREHQGSQTLIDYSGTIPEQPTNVSVRRTFVRPNREGNSESITQIQGTLPETNATHLTVNAFRENSPVRLAFAESPRGATGRGTVLPYDDVHIGAQNVSSQGDYKFQETITGVGLSQWSDLKFRAAYLTVDETDAGGTSQATFYDAVEVGDIVRLEVATDRWISWQITAAPEEFGNNRRFKLRRTGFVEGGGTAPISDGAVTFRWYTEFNSELTIVEIALQPGNRYDLTVHAHNVNNVLDRRDSLGVEIDAHVAAINEEKPATPADLVVMGGAGFNTITWTKNSEPWVAEYKIYRGNSNIFTRAVEIAEVSEPRFIDTDNTIIGVTRYYWVRAISKSEVASDPAGSVSAQAQEAGFQPPDRPNAPGAPATSGMNTGQGVYQSADGRTLAYLQVRNPAMPANAAYMNILYRQTGGQWRIADQVFMGGGPTRIDDLTPGIRYEFAARAISAVGAASAVGVSVERIAPGDTTRPGTVTGLKVTVFGKLSKITWTKLNDDTVKEYIVYGGNSAAPTREIGRTDSTEYLDDAAYVTTRYWRLKAIDYSGNTSADFSNTVSTRGSQIGDDDILEINASKITAGEIITGGPNHATGLTVQSGADIEFYQAPDAGGPDNIEAQSAIDFFGEGRRNPFVGLTALNIIADPPRADGITGLMMIGPYAKDVNALSLGITEARSTRQYVWDVVQMFATTRITLKGPVTIGTLDSNNDGTLNVRTINGVPSNNKALTLNGNVTINGDLTVTGTVSSEDTSSTPTITDVNIFPTGTVADNTRLTASATGSPTGGTLAYQWQYRTVGNRTWIDSSRSSTITARTSGSSSREYRCCVTYTLMGTEVGPEYTDIVTVTNEDVPEIRNVRISPTGTVADNTRLTASATGSPTGGTLAYQWQYRTVGNRTWIDSSRSSTITARTSGSSSREYRCCITYTYMGTEVGPEYTDIVTAADEDAPEIRNVRISPTGTVADNTRLTASATGDPGGGRIAYQWQWRTLGTSSWTTSSTTSSFITARSAGSSSREYRCCIRYTLSGTTVGPEYTSIVRVTPPAVRPSITRVTISPTGAVASGTQLTIIATVNPTGGTILYEWQRRSQTGSSWGGWGRISGSSNRLTTRTVPSIYSAEQYRCCVRYQLRGTTVGPTYSAAVSVAAPTTAPRITGVSISGSTALNSVLTCTATATPSGGTFAYQWEYRTRVFGGVFVSWQNARGGTSRTHTVNVGFAQWRCAVTYTRLGRTVGPSYSNILS